MQQQALSTIVAWLRLQRAEEALERELKQGFGVTSLQLSVLRILAERPRLPLAALRKALVAHPATLGQAIDGLRRRDLVLVRTDPQDRRARNVALTPAGRQLIEAAPLAGAMRLREVQVDPARLDRLTAALEDAVELFDLQDWAPGRREA
jgi:DNA-binding MarR family transcriptional regulator